MAQANNGAWRSLHLGAGLLHKVEETGSELSNPRTLTEADRLARNQVFANPKGSGSRGNEMCSGALRNAAGCDEGHMRQRSFESANIVVSANIGTGEDLYKIGSRLMKRA